MKRLFSLLMLVCLSASMLFANAVADDAPTKKVLVFSDYSNEYVSTNAVELKTANLDVFKADALIYDLALFSRSRLDYNSFANNLNTDRVFLSKNYKEIKRPNAIGYLRAREGIKYSRNSMS